MAELREANMVQAGVRHSAVDSEGDFKYIGFYPKVSQNTRKLAGKTGLLQHS
jgi:hypothetical protein